MTKEKVEQANSLDKKIKDLKSAMNCFEWTPDGSSVPVSLNPRLIIEFDDGDEGRVDMPIPMNLSNEMIKFIKGEISNSLVTALDEFNAL
tara:strand:+ start:380 stop:649 length:270 start_codon:yes stop_codon:yes gene_type:complete